jgi:CubicO group peptidase (beta-lactamase class C family)
LVLHDPAETSPYLSPPTLFSGGAGLVSTADDFMKFCNLLLGHGNGLLQNDTIERMTSNQLPPELLPIYFAGPRTGLGFGLGVSVVIGRVPLVPSSPLSEYGWGGAASTHFWISPQHQLACIAMTQKMPFTYDLENRVKSIVYRAINA